MERNGKMAVSSLVGRINRINRIISKQLNKKAVIFKPEVPKVKSFLP